MGKKVSINGLADAVMEELTEYNRLAEETMKKAVTKAGKTVRKEIQAGAPVKSGKYAKSWRTKKTKATISFLLSMGKKNSLLMELSFKNIFQGIESL